MSTNRRCSVCDEWYDPNGERATVHEHPEPQSGPQRAAWLASGKPWSEYEPIAQERRRAVRAMVFAFHELNPIRAQYGAPCGVNHEWFSSVVDRLDDSVKELTGLSAHCHPELYKEDQ